ncbi:MAG TPA: hypothetical protein VFB78_17800 [Acidimicrobiales bacterium]|nr:hypothetical protein [Acidimicrobiales bacterium]
MSIYRCLSRVAAVVGALIFLVVALSPPAQASGNGAGVVDGSQVYSPGTYPADPVVTYPVLRMQGRIKVAGQAYGGGFEITGMTAVPGYPSGHCVGLDCVQPLGYTTFYGRDAGAVRGIGSNFYAVNGTCKIRYDSSMDTGPLYLVQIEREITIDCVARVLGSAPTPFTITVAGHDDYVGHIVGAFIVS